MAYLTNSRCAVLVLICWLTTCPVSVTLGQTRVTVTTKIGEIIGLEESDHLPDQSGQTLHVFRGIPYAQAPVGDLRFAKPQPATPFSPYSFDALQFGPACPQPAISQDKMSENCLSLNIYAPKAPSTNQSAALPVVLWIHGGAFVSGEGKQLPGENLAAFGNIVVVTINYRLGALGFLATDDGEARGNFGLWDQRLALKWVSENIAEFGGDPGNVTLAGTTSGAYCVTYHALSPHSAGLFHRILAESGTALSLAGYNRKGWKYAKKLADVLGCKAEGRSENAKLMSCLRGKSFHDIIGTVVRPSKPFLLSWAPVIDGDFILNDPSATLLQWTHLHSSPSPSFTSSPSTLSSSFPPSSYSPPSSPSTSPPSSSLPNDSSSSLSPSSSSPASTPSPPLPIPPKFPSLDAMIGTTSSDGSIMFDIWVKAIASARKENVTSGVSRALVGAVVTALTEAADSVGAVKDAVFQEYTDWEDPEEAGPRARQLIELLTDKGFFVPSVQFARSHARGSGDVTDGPKTYCYVFHQPAPWAPSPYPWFRGSRHKDHDLFVLGLPGSLVNVSTETGSKLYSFSKSVMTYWANFVKTGNPNSPDRPSVEWPSFTPDMENYLHLEEGATAARRHYRARKVAFWLDYIPKVKVTAQTQPCDRGGTGVSSAKFDSTRATCIMTMCVMAAMNLRN